MKRPKRAKKLKQPFRLIIKLLVLAVIVLALKSGFDTAFEMVYPLRHDDVITQYSQEYSLDRYLVMGVIKAESNYIHDAHSGVARGLMQITDDTAKWIAGKLNIEFTADDIEDPDTNIRMGCYYLSYLINRYGDINVALAAYNGGMGNVDKWLSDSRYSSDGKTLSDIPFPETEKYVERVNKYTGIYKWWYSKDKS